MSYRSYRSGIGQRRLSHVFDFGTGELGDELSRPIHETLKLRTNSHELHHLLCVPSL